MSFSRACILAAVAAFAVAACGNGGTPSDAGADAAVESGTGDSGSDGGGDSGGADSGADTSTCTTTLCVHGDQPNQCPSCAPSDGDICSPPAAVTCNYSNGCSGAQAETRQCTCVLPDAGAGDAGSSGDAIWSCTGSP